MVSKVAKVLLLPAAFCLALIGFGCGYFGHLDHRGVVHALFILSCFGGRGLWADLFCIFVWLSANGHCTAGSLPSAGLASS